MTVGGKIKALRTEKGLSLRQLSQESDVSSPTICQIENGQTFPHKDRIRWLAEALKADEDDLLAEYAVQELQRLGYDDPIPETVATLIRADEETRQEALELVVGIIETREPRKLPPAGDLPARHR